MRTWADRRGASTLIVFLPPAMATADDLIERGFVTALRASNAAADIVLAEVTHADVMQQRASAALRDAVIAPALASGYREIWLAGISLGAFNALHYVARFAGDVVGLCLLAPYPGTGDILREIAQAGGIDAWAATPDRSREDERVWWHWLWQQSHVEPADIPVYVGLSDNDRFLQGQKMLAGLIPREHVDTIPGTHDWPVWQILWQRWLDKRWLDKDRLNGSRR